MQNKVWDVYFVYGAPNTHDGPTIWEAIWSYLYELNLPTLLIGNFNQVEYYTNKLGGSGKIRGWEEFTYWKMNLGLIDLPFTGPQFIWCYKQFDTDLMFELLDQASCTIEWKTYTRTQM